MYNDDFFDDEYHAIEDVLLEYFKMKKGEAHRLLTEDDFENIIDYFDTNNDNENFQYATEMATTLYPYSAILILRNAEYLVDHKKFGQAMLLLDKLEEIDPNNVECVFLRSDILLEQNKLNEAIQFLESKIDDFQSIDKTDLLIQLSEVYDEVEDFEKVYSTLERILKYDPNNEDALMRICFWAEINNKQEESIALHKNIIEESPYNAMAWYNLGVAYQGLKLHEKAIDAYEYCLAIDDKFEYAYRNIGDAYMQIKQYNKAIEVLEMHLSISKPEDVILEAIGHCWEKQKNYPKARHFYRRASQLNPQDDNIFFKIGETYSKEEKWEKALKAYSVALHINKNNASYCMALGNCLLEMNAGREALVCFLNAVQLRPDIKSTWQALIKALYQNDYFDEALIQLTIAQEHCGLKPEFEYYKAGILLAKGRTKEAVLQLELALSINDKKTSALNYIDTELKQHPAFSEVLVRYKKKK
ncbi:MAG: tetratricopeptide repeat protein [Chitinophagaceae bacterium]